MKRISLIVSFLFLYICSYSQSSLGIELPKIIPAAPNSHELGKYGDIPVGNFTGSVQPKISLLEFKTQNLSVPISLNYSSNGIKVDQYRSNVGLGWSLSIGGVITRTVRQRPDEDRTSEIPESVFNSLNSDESIMFLFNSAKNTESDSQVDIFNFNFLGKTGRFVLDKTKNPVLLDYSALEIERIPNGFKITDEAGISYFFDVQETSQTRNQGGAHEPWSDLFVTSWYLSKMKHPKGDEIYFSYTPFNQNYNLGKSQNITWYEPASCGSTLIGSVSGSYEFSQIISNYGNFNTHILTSITSNNNQFGKISVVNLASGIVDKIKYFDRNNVIIDNVIFEYYSNPNNRIFLQNISFKNIKKEYTFNYIKPDQFPERLSFSQDHWGYYNGKSNSVLYPNPSKIENIGLPFKNRDKGANKEIDFSFTEIGLLQKIIYPTKGDTEFEFEGNGYAGIKKILPQKTYVNAVAETRSNELQKTVSIVLDNIKFSHEINIINSLVANTNDNSCGSDFGDVISHKEIADIKIENITNPNSIPSFFRKLENTDSYMGNSFSIKPNKPIENVYVKLMKDNDYRITVSIDRASCLRANVSTFYYQGNYTTVNTSIPQGGMRIKRVVNTLENGKKEIKRYYYAEKERLNKCSGFKGVTPWYIRDSYANYTCPGGVIEYRGSKVLNSSSIRSLFHNSNSFNTKYRTVTVSYGGDNFENGGQEFHYIINEDRYGKILKGSHIQGSVRNNFGWDNSLLKKVNSFRKENDRIVNLKTIENFYKRDTRKDVIVKGLTIRKNYDLQLILNHPNYLNIKNLDVMENSYRTNWFYLNKSIEKQYNHEGKNPITTTTNYYYDNPSHLQQTRVEKINSKGEVLKTKLYYPDDKLELSDLDDESSIAIDTLKLQHRIAEPIQTDTYKNGVLLSSQRTNYKKWVNGIVLPKELKTLKGVSSNTNKLEERITYHDYDDKGNPIDVGKSGGARVVYVWGYNKSYPIIKIEGLSRSYKSIDDKLKQLRGINFTTLQRLSNEDTNLITEQNLRDSYKSLYTVLKSLYPTAQLTTYTYDPLIGVTSITDPREETVYYEYDDFNRLEYVKDSNKNILKEYKYKYKSNNYED